MIGEIVISTTDQAFIDRFCGVLQYTILYPPEYNSFATSNAPVKGQTFNFDIDAKTNEVIGKY
jgi:hypothetical protein